MRVPTSWLSRSFALPWPALAKYDHNRAPCFSERPSKGNKMKSHTEYLTFHLPARMAFENITPKIEEIVKKSCVKEGLVLCNAMHITASVFINDDESGLHEDYKKWLESLAPF